MGRFDFAPGDGSFPASRVDQSTELDALMARLADGDRSAFTPVFQRLWPSVHRLCSSLTQNAADADDAAQQALEKIFTRASDYDPARAALPWALAITAWECRTLRRQRGRRRELPEEGNVERASDAALEEELTRRDLVAAALHAVAELSATDQETLMATFEERAASVQGTTLRKRRERAITRLRDTFRRLYGLG
jgi:RNA polymerase sigma-70 factor, ECF subfamily